MFAPTNYESKPTFITIPQSLPNKLSVSKRILKDGYFKMIWVGTDIIDLLDKEKISFQVSLTELNSILETGGYSKGEQAYIRRMRHQGRNNVAAKRLRLKKRKEEISEEDSISCLEKEKLRLIMAADQLRSEIKFYRTEIVENIQ